MGMDQRSCPRERMVKLASWMIGLVDEDWDQPHVHEMTEAAGLKNQNGSRADDERAAAAIRNDLEWMIAHLNTMLGAPLKPIPGWIGSIGDSVRVRKNVRWCAMRRGTVVDRVHGMYEVRLDGDPNTRVYRSDELEKA